MDPTGPTPTDPEQAPITPDETRRVAELARLALSDDQLAALGDDLAGILRHVRALDALDLEGVEPLTHPLDVTNRLDDDEARPPLDRRTALDLAPDAEGPYIRVPKVLPAGPAQGG